MRTSVEWMERNQIPLYLAALVFGAAVGLLVPAVAHPAELTKWGGAGGHGGGSHSATKTQKVSGVSRYAGATRAAAPPWRAKYRAQLQPPASATA